MLRFVGGLAVGLVLSVAYVANAQTSPAPPPPVPQIIVTTTSTTEPVTTTTTQAPTTTTTKPHRTSIWRDVDVCGRGPNYPSDWYTGEVPQATPGDPQPDPRRCPDQYRDWLVRQGAVTPAVTHCIREDQDGYFWTTGDRAYTQSVYSGKRYSCLGITPEQWEANK